MKVNYLKKYNREVRVLQIIILIILLLFVANVIRKYIIIESLHQKFNETVQNLNNYHMKVILMSNNSQDSTQIYIRETYYKDKNFITIHNIETENRKQSLVYRKNDYEESAILIANENGKITTTHIDYGADIDAYALEPTIAYYWQDAFFKNLYTAIFEKIERVNIKGQDCYAIGSRYGGIEYVDAATGNDIKMVNLETNTILDEYLEIGNVKDSDVVPPNSFF